MIIHTGFVGKRLVSCNRISCYLLAVEPGERGEDGHVDGDVDRVAGQAGQHTQQAVKEGVEMVTDRTRQVQRAVNQQQRCLPRTRLTQRTQHVQIEKRKRTVIILRRKFA